MPNPQRRRSRRPARAAWCARFTCWQATYWCFLEKAYDASTEIFKRLRKRVAPQPPPPWKCKLAFSCSLHFKNASHVGFDHANAEGRRPLTGVGSVLPCLRLLLLPPGLLPFSSARSSMWGPLPLSPWVVFLTPAAPLPPPLPLLARMERSHRAGPTQASCQTTI